MPSFNPIYPAPLPTPWFLGSPMLAASAVASAAVLTANKTYLEGIWVPVPMTLVSATVGHGGVHAGNLDMGLYDQNGNLLGHTGVTAASAGVQTANLLTPLFLNPGLYYSALWVDNSTDTYFCLTGENQSVDNFLVSVGTNGGGLASTFAGMGGAGAGTVIMPFLFHIQGTGF